MSNREKSDLTSPVPGAIASDARTGCEFETVLVQGRRLECLDLPAAKDGRPPVVLLHEGLGSITTWRDFPQRLAVATGCRVVAWSRAGYGGSDPCEAPRTPRYLHVEAEEALPALLAGLDISRPVLVGHSDGGTIALLHAAAFPDAVTAVVAMAPHEFVEEDTLAGLRAAREAWRDSNWRDRLRRHHRDVDRVFREWNETWLSADFRDWNIEESLSAIRCPVLAIQGYGDGYATMRQVDVIAERVPRTTLVKLPGCGHCPHLDQPEQALAAITDFLECLLGE